MHVMKLLNLSKTLTLSKYGVISGPYFRVFGLNTEIFEVNLRIESEYRKIRTRNNSVLRHFSRSVIGLLPLYNYNHTHIHIYLQDLVLRHIHFYLDVVTLMTKSPKNPFVSWIVYRKSFLYLYYENLFQIHGIAVSVQKRDILRDKH